MNKILLATMDSHWENCGTAQTHRAVLLRLARMGLRFVDMKSLLFGDMDMSETLFKAVRFDLGRLVKFVELGEIGLLDIQRPFVWKNVKVRNLFDSMDHGYPIGYLLFWENGLTDDSRSIGVDQKQKVARLLIVDGQQRLTPIHAVIQGNPGHPREL